MVFIIEKSNPTIMNKKAFLFTAIAATLLILNSCQKNEEKIIPRNLEELQAPESFSWTTEKVVNLSITGLPTIVPVQSTLSVELPDGTKVFSRNHLMSENLNLALTVPSTVSQLKLRFGQNEYLLDNLSTSVSFSFIPKSE